MRDEAAIIADHDAPQLDGGVEGGGHHPARHGLVHERCQHAESFILSHTNTQVT